MNDMDGIAPVGADCSILPAPSLNPPTCDFVPFEAVEDRLVEAFQTLWALPDPSPPPRCKISAIWRESVRDRVDVDCEPSPARPGVGRWQYARMEEALGWCEALSPDARRVVGRVVTQLAKGRQRVEWPLVRRDLGERRTTDALRKVYSRALNRICVSING